MTAARGKTLKKSGGGARSGGAKKGSAKKVEKTADGRHVRIDGRLWRATNPDLPEDERERLVRQLMEARRDVGAALRAGDDEAEREARARVHRAKVALGERGPKWWEQEGVGAKKTRRASGAAKKDRRD